MAFMGWSILSASFALIIIFPLFNLMKGSKNPQLPKLMMPLNRDYIKKPGRVNFLKGYTDFYSVTPLEGQGSDALQSFAMANCLIFTSEQAVKIEEGEQVDQNEFNKILISESRKFKYLTLSE